MCDWQNLTPPSKAKYRTLPRDYTSMENPIMSEKLEEVCQEIEQGYTQNFILCMEQLFPALMTPDFANQNVILLSTKIGNGNKEEIIPSLSIYKSANDSPSVVLSSNELWSFLEKRSKIETTGGEKTKSLTDILKYAVGINFIAHYFGEYRTVVLVGQDKHFEDEGKLNKLARSLFYIRHKSLNLLNDSNQFADKNREELTKQFTEDIHSAVDTISQYIKSNYEVDAFALQYSDKENGWACKQTCPFGITDTVNSYIDRTSDEVKPIAGLSMDKYFIIFPFISTLVRRDLQNLILIQSNRPIPIYIVTNLRYFTNYYFAVYLEERKSDLLENLQKKTLRLYDEIERMIDSGHEINPHEQMRQFLEPAFHLALLATNAFSATLRLYNPESDSLELIYATGSKRVEAASTQDIDQIPAKDYYKSQVAFVFNFGKPDDDGKYEPNVKGGSTYREHRTNSQSELCFCVFFKQIAVGVLNFESPQKNGFQHDQRFLKKIRSSLESYITALYESNDKQWLSRRSKIYQNLHEIKNVINSDRFPRELTEEIDKYIEVNETVDRSVEPVMFLEIKHFRNEYIENYSKELERTAPIKVVRQEMVENFSRMCTISHINPKKTVPQYKLNLMNILYKNLLDNYRKWGNHEKDFVRATVNSSQTKIIFNVISSSLYDENIIKKLLVEPYTTIEQNSNKAHYGMFIIGMIARHLGGYAYVLNKEEQSISQLIIKIPI